jgi:hypothetical protein
MFREISTENFVRKREDWRKTSLGVIVCSVVYALVMNVLYDRLPIRIINFHHWFMLILVVANFLLSFYVGKVLSVCPVCHQMIPTTRGRYQSLRENLVFLATDHCQTIVHTVVKTLNNIKLLNLNSIKQPFGAVFSFI